MSHIAQRPKSAPVARATVPTPIEEDEVCDTPVDLTADTEAYKNEMGGGKSNVMVCVRMRPESQKEKGSKTIVKNLDGKVIVFDPPEDEEEAASGNGERGHKGGDKKTAWSGVPFTGRRAKDHRYAFDTVFDASATQAQVYDGTTTFLIEGVMEGYNATVFAYGATGSGKTHTMIGDMRNNPGIMVRTVVDLFNRIQKRSNEVTCTVSVTFLEVYNETIRDLLVSDGARAPPLELREDAEKGMVVAGLREEVIVSAHQVVGLIERGNSNRTTSPTDANAVSSRSHAVLQITVQQKDRTANTSTSLNVGKLSLIDLAGSERAAGTKNRGTTMIEGANINKSLLALGNCINALVEIGDGKFSSSAYVPYRNSKLTRLLKDSLGGNCRTVMIANVSPSSLSYEDTHNTLKYANRAKNIRTKVTRNVLNVNFHISRYTQIIRDLRSEVEELKDKLRVTTHNTDHDDAGSDQIELQSLRAELKKIHEERTRAVNTLVQLENIDYWNEFEVDRIDKELEKMESVYPPESRTPDYTRKKSRGEKRRENEKTRNTLQKSITERQAKEKEILKLAKLKIKTADKRIIIKQEAQINELSAKYMHLEQKHEQAQRILQKQTEYIKRLQKYSRQHRMEVMAPEGEDAGATLLQPRGLPSRKNRKSTAGSDDVDETGLRKSRSAWEFDAKVCEEMESDIQLEDTQGEGDLDDVPIEVTVEEDLNGDPNEPALDLEPPQDIALPSSRRKSDPVITPRVFREVAIVEENIEILDNDIGSGFNDDEDRPMTAPSTGSSAHGGATVPAFDISSSSILEMQSIHPAPSKMKGAASGRLGGPYLKILPSVLQTKKKKKKLDDTTQLEEVDERKGVAERSRVSSRNDTSPPQTESSGVVPLKKSTSATSVYGAVKPTTRSNSSLSTSVVVERGQARKVRKDLSAVSVSGTGVTGRSAARGNKENSMPARGARERDTDSYKFSPPQPDRERATVKVSLRKPVKKASAADRERLAEKFNAYAPGKSMPAGSRLSQKRNLRKREKASALDTSNSSVSGSYDKPCVASEEDRDLSFGSSRRGADDISSDGSDNDHNARESTNRVVFSLRSIVEGTGPYE